MRFLEEHEHHDDELPEEPEERMVAQQPGMLNVGPPPFRPPGGRERILFSEASAGDYKEGIGLPWIIVVIIAVLGIWFAMTR
jgi:hypothetical protein